MPVMTDYHCNNCGHNFSLEILTKDEAQKARDKGEPLSGIHCPKCHRTDLIKLRSAA